MSAKPSISIALAVCLSLSAVALLPLAGCQKKAPKPLSRLETLEIQVVQDEQALNEQEQKYKTDREAASQKGDKEQVRYLDLSTRERLVNERKMLQMKQKELKKLRKEAGLSESK